MLRAALPALFLLGAACATVPPPADLAAPIERKVPVLPSAPTPAPTGRGLVILDSVSGPARAARILPSQRSTPPEARWRGPWSADGQAFEPLCSATPCPAYLPYGTQEVLLESNEDARRKGIYPLDVTDRPVVLRASLDADVPPGPGRVAGAVLVVSGLGLMTLGVTTFAGQDSSSSPQALEAAGWTAIGVGAAAAILGGILWARNAPAHYRGRAVQWTP